MLAKLLLFQEETKEDKEKDGLLEGVILMDLQRTQPKLNLFSLLKMQENKTYFLMCN